MESSAKTETGETQTSRFADLVRARYGDRAPNVGKGDPLLEIMLSHRSVRAYLDTAVPQAHIETAIAAAQSAPSSSNLQVWSVVTVTDRERKARLAELAGDQAHIRAAPLLLVWLADLSRLRKVTAIEEHPAEGLDYAELFLTAAIDATLAAQNAQNAFEALGYGTCYIGSMRSHPTEVAAELALPPEVFGVFGMTVGLEDPARRTAIKPRLSQRTVLFRERYDDSALHEDVSAYNATMDAFQAGQKMAPLTWSRKSSQRVASPASLKNRDKLKAYLKTMGFQLK